jgi:hypothetical protein
MPGVYLPLSILFAPIVLLTSVGLFVFLRQKKANPTENTDNIAWLLIILFIVAMLSIGIFIAFIFLHGFAR